MVALKKAQLMKPLTALYLTQRLAYAWPICNLMLTKPTKKSFIINWREKALTDCV